MQRVAFCLRVREDRLEEYKRVHHEVWPELLRDLKAASVRNYSIFSRGPELFGYMECENYTSVMEALGRSLANKRWQERMKEYLATPVDMDEAEPLELLEEVFHLD